MRCCISLAVATLACSPPAAPAPGGRPAPPAGWDDAVRLPEAVDINPASDVVEVNLDASVTPLEVTPGLTTPVWTYNGLLPGPLIRAHVGDRVIVHLTNDLPEDTTVHWHGVRVPAAMDGVAGHSQAAVPPGGSFDYAFTVPDASLFWYHPHVDSAAQVGFGLYGPLLVEDPADPAAGLGDEVVLVLSDIAISADGTQEPADAGGDIATLFGREGNQMLVNGRITPTLLARNGLRQRWRIVNAAKSRFFQLVLAGHTFTRIGGDGGLLPAPEVSDSLLVIPGGRADVLVTPEGAPGALLAVKWTAYDRGFGTAYMRPDQDLLYLRIVNDTPVHEAPVPDTLRAIDPFDTAGATPQPITLTEDASSGMLVLGINGVPISMAQPIYVSVGETDLWTIQNTMDWDHPFHLHGFFFQVIDDATGAPIPEWRDTFDVPANATRQMIVRYEDRPGMWMFHCHILDHADAGMMGMLMLQ
jgi:FtsP/CotA-like multicopper oxidase with cupredoxin domain